MISTSRTPASVFASASLKRERCRSTCATSRSIISPIRKPASPSVAIIARRPRPLAVARRLGLELGGGVEQGVELIDLEERPLGPRAFQEPRRAPADPHRVAVDQLVVDRLLEDLPEQREQHVDRGVRQRAPSARWCVRPPLVGRGFHQRPAARPRDADRLRLLGELVAEAVDQPRRDLAQPVAAEEPLQVVEPPAVVDEGLLREVELLGAPPALRRTAEGLVDGTPSAAIASSSRSWRGSSRGGTHVPRSICCTIRSVSSSARVRFQPCLLVPKVTFS